MVQVLPHILKHLYDVDVLDKKEMLKCYEEENGPGGLREAVQVIIE